MKHWIHDESVQAAVAFGAYGLAIGAALMLVYVGLPMTGFGIGGIVAAIPILLSGSEVVAIVKAHRAKRLQTLTEIAQAAQKRSVPPRRAPSKKPPEDTPENLPQRFCSDCGQEFIWSSAAIGFDYRNGKPRVSTEGHCPDWTQARSDEPGDCGNPIAPTWVPQPSHQTLLHTASTTPLTAECPGCRWELVRTGMITQNEADALALIYP